ncbi:MAG TPA: DUF4212 domain-containing protein [Telluria sp.]|nr:DUF4212 domain-containing protein [Telluria sp.]
MDHQDQDNPQARARRDAIVAARRRHWLRLRRLTTALFALWFASVLLVVWFARELAQISLFGWPLSFYLAAQGSALIYLAIIAAYAWQTRRLDADYHRELDQP